jgi:hypothetical protein
MNRIKMTLWIIGALACGLLGVVLWHIRVPQALITAIWPVRTFYTVRAEIELDGATHVLEGVGSCDWRWHVPLPMLYYDYGRLTFRGGFLTKVLDDGRAIVIFPGRHCIPRVDKSDDAPPGSYWRWSKVFNQPDKFFYEVDLATGDIRYPDGTRHDDVIAKGDLFPRVLVLDNARAPQTIRDYPNPKEHMASDCASLRIKSYRVTNSSSGTITRRELDVPYLANLKTRETWIGFLGRTIPFSAFDAVPWVVARIAQQPPYTPWDAVMTTRGSLPDWRTAPDWDDAERRSSNPDDRWTLRDNETGRKVAWRELDLRRPPAREIGWDPARARVAYPTQPVGTCEGVVTLFPEPRTVTFEADGKDIARDLPPRTFLIDTHTRALVAIEREFVSFSPPGTAED